MVLQEAKAKASLTTIAKGSERELSTFRNIMADAPEGSSLKLDMQALVDLETKELSLLHTVLTRDLPSAGQLAKQAAIAGGRGAAHLAGRGLSAIGRRLSALETEPGRLPVVDELMVRNGLSVPGERHPRRAIASGSYYLDARLGQLRNIKNPNAVIPLNEFEVSWFAERAH